ncbi:hypothetical protein U9M48_039176 [Paspalum notatum var. saurae]|uniref:Reverse transcriptase n=1 Tax=Paspalum notatum var. saurae TaxID=547442 RepID=A0AAQ3UPR8_PASNO
MTCDWAERKLEFQMANTTVTLQGIHSSPLTLTASNGTQVCKWLSGNDVWALALVDMSSATADVDSQSTPTSAPPTPVLQLLDDYKDIFQEPKALPPPKAYDHHIPLLPNVVLVNCRPYRYSPLHKTEIEKQVHDLLAAGLITHSTSPFASPVLLVQKKDGSWRICVDYRKLNALTIKNRFPMLVIEEILDELGRAKYFTKLDMKSGYHQVRVAVVDEHKTGFKTHHGHYQFRVMPFGLTNAPATFQCIMNEVLSPFLRKFVLVFVDDILIFSNTLDEHLHHLKLRKCSFGQHSVAYLGHIISQEGLATDPQKTEAMVNWPRPTNMTELRAFLGLTNYYRLFVYHYGHLAKPLYKILQLKQFLWSDIADLGLTNYYRLFMYHYGHLAKPLYKILQLKQFLWSDIAEQAFMNLKQTMTNTPVLIIPDFELPFTIETAACDTGIGAILMQQGRPVAYLSKAFGPSHIKYSIYEKGISDSYNGCRQEFIIKTDHKSLAYLMEQNLQSDLQRKAMARLMGFKFRIVYNKGKNNVAANTLSRINHLMVLQAVSTVTPAWIQEVLNSYTTNSRAQVLLSQLALASPNAEGFSLELGHSGINNTFYKVKKLFHWKGMKLHVEEFIKQCAICQQAKHSLHHTPGLLQQLPIPTNVWQDISIDFVEGLPKSEGYNAILVVVDRLTKFAHFIAIKHPYTATGIARIILDQVELFVSDRDSIFLSYFWQELFKLYDVKLHLSTAYHLQTDRQTERVNQILEMYLRCAIHDNPKTMETMAVTSRIVVQFHFSLGYQMFSFQSFVWSRAKYVNTLLTDRAVQLQNLKHHLEVAQNLLERVGTVAYRLDLPPHSAIHPVFHVSQLKPYTTDYSPVFSTLPTIPDLDAPSVEPAAILERRLVKRGNSSVPQVRVQWTFLPPGRIIMWCGRVSLT